MEIKGENFIKNVQIKQEQEELQAQIDQLDQNIESPTASSYDYQKNQEENELDDIMLEDNGKSGATKSNKTKYIALGLALIILFLLTIVAFRLLNNESTKNSAFVENKEDIKQDKALNDDNIEQQYQKIINEKLKTIKDQKTELENKKASKSLSLTEIEKEEQKVVVSKNVKEVKKTKELKEDIFKIKNSKTVAQPKKETSNINAIKVAPKKEIDKILATPKKKITKVEKPVFKSAPKKVEKKTVTNKKATSAMTSKPKGSFVQIGAFSKPISQEYLKNIKTQGLNYRLYKVDINNKTYTKVLIGPYRNKAHAQTSLSQVKKKLNIDSAFILSF